MIISIDKMNSSVLIYQENCTRADPAVVFSLVVFDFNGCRTKTVGYSSLSRPGTRHIDRKVLSWWPMATDTPTMVCFPLFTQ